MKNRSRLTGVSLGFAAAAVAALVAARGRDVRAVARRAAALEQTASTAQAGRFDPSMVADLPEPARRYFLHAIAPGAPLVGPVRLAMSGTMRLGPQQPWLPLRARQVLAPPAGFVWNAVVGEGLKRFAGADSYANGQGRVAFRLWDLVPVVRAGGPDVTRSARGRLAIESIWQPAALLPQRGVVWSAIDDGSARATVTVDDTSIPLTLAIAPDGSLRSVVMERWGNLSTDGTFGSLPFGAEVRADHTFGGYTVPSDLSVSWWYGTDRAFCFFRVQVTRATFLAA